MESVDMGEPRPTNSPKPSTIVAAEQKSEIPTPEISQATPSENQKIKTLGKDFNKIAQLDEAKKEFESKIKQLTPEEQAKAIVNFENWYTGNFNPETGKITLYRFVDFDAAYPLEEVIKKGVRPRGVMELGSEDALLAYLEKSGDNELAAVFRRQKAGEDISDFIKNYSLSSGGGSTHGLASYWTTHKDFYSKTRDYRIAIELDPDEAWRTDANIDSDYFNPNDFINGAELEWTVLGNIPREKIIEIIHNPTGKNALESPELFEMKGVRSVEELAEKVKKGNVDRDDIFTALKSKNIVLNISERDYLSTLDPKTLLSLGEIGASSPEIFSIPPLNDIVDMLRDGMSKEFITETLRGKMTIPTS